MFWWRDEPDGVDLAFTDREGGLGRGPGGALNLAGHIGAEPEVVAANRERVAAQWGVSAESMVWMDQVHGSEVVVVDAPAPPQPCDAMVTRTVELTLGVLVADCVPVLLHDVRAGVVGVAHAGRAGMMAAVVPAAVRAARALGAHDLRAVVGPSVCPRCYEVPDNLAQAAAEVVPAALSVSWTGTAAIDVAGAVVSQLRQDAVPVTWVPGCTREEPRLYSHRRDPSSGRFAGLVRLVAA